MEGTRLLPGSPVGGWGLPFWSRTRSHIGVDDQTKSGAGGCLGTFLLFPAVACLLLGAIFWVAPLIYAGVVLTGLFFGLLFWMRPVRDLLKPALQAAAIWIILGAFGMAVTWLLGGPGSGVVDYLCDTGPLATRC